MVEEEYCEYGDDGIISTLEEQEANDHEHVYKFVTAGYRKTDVYECKICGKTKHERHYD